MQTLGVKLHKEQCYKHKLKPVEMIIASKEAILRNEKVQTDRTISNNKPITIIGGNEKRTCLLVNTEISGGINLIRNMERLLKYKPYYINAVYLKCKIVIPII